MATVIRKSGGSTRVDSDSNFVRIDWGSVVDNRGYQGRSIGKNSSYTFTIPQGHRVAIATVYVTSPNQVNTDCQLTGWSSNVIVAKEVSRSGWLASYLSNADWGHAQSVVTYYFETNGDEATFTLRENNAANNYNLKVFLSAVPD